MGDVEGKRERKPNPKYSDSDMQKRKNSDTPAKDDPKRKKTVQEPTTHHMNIHDAQAKVEDLEKQLVTLRKRLDEKDAQILSLQKKVDDFEDSEGNDIEDKESEISNLKEKVEDLKQKLQDKKSEIEELDDKNNKVEGQRIKLEEEIEAKDYTIAKLNEEKKELGFGIKNVKAKVKELEEKNSTLQAKVQQLEKQNSTLQPKVKELEEKNSALQAKVKELEEKNSTLQTKVQQARKERDAYMAKVQSYETEFGIISLENSDEQKKKHYKMLEDSLSLLVTDEEGMIDFGPKKFTRDQILEFGKKVPVKAFVTATTYILELATIALGKDCSKQACESFVFKMVEANEEWLPDSEDAPNAAEESINAAPTAAEASVVVEPINAAPNAEEASVVVEPNTAEEPINAAPNAEEASIITADAVQPEAVDPNPNQQANAKSPANGLDEGFFDGFSW